MQSAIRKARASARQEATSQVVELAALERVALKELQKSLLNIARLADKHQREFKLKSTELDQVYQSLLDAQVAAHLVAIKRTAAQVKGAGYTPPTQFNNPLTLSLAISAPLLRQVTPEAIDGLRSKYSATTIDVIQNLTTRLNTGVRQALEDAVVSQVTPKAAIKSFFARAGLIESEGKPAHFFSTLLRTQTQLVYSSARWDEYQRPEIDEIIWGYTYVTVGDDRVREEHIKLDGMTLPKDAPEWRTFWPPNGYNCRCQTIPVFDPEPTKKPPPSAVADPGFDFNPGTVDLQPVYAPVIPTPAPPPKPKPAVEKSVLRSKKPPDVQWLGPNEGAEERQAWKDAGFSVDPATLIGAPNGTVVEVSHFKHSNQWLIRASGGPVNRMDRTIRQAKDGSGWQIKNEEIRLSKSKAPPGLGREILKNQVRNAKAAGITKIYTEAAGDKDSPLYNGYYTWPRYGYDGKLTDIAELSVEKEINKRFPGAKTVLDVMSTEEGRVWWKENGTNFNAEFDLSEGSRSLKVFNAYLAAKGESGV